MTGKVSPKIFRLCSLSLLLLVIGCRREAGLAGVRMGVSRECQGLGFTAQTISPAAGIQEIESGRLDVVVGPFSDVLLAAAEGKHIVAFGLVRQTRLALVTKTPARTMEELAGQQVRVPGAGTLAHQFLNLLVSEVSLVGDFVNVVTTPAANEVVRWEEAAGRTVIADSTAKLGAPLPECVLYASQAWLRRHRDLARVLAARARPLKPESVEAMRKLVQASYQRARHLPEDLNAFYTNRFVPPGVE